jgi:hypothetical protein
MSDEPIDKQAINEAWEAAKAREAEEARQKAVVDETQNIPAGEPPEFTEPEKPAYLGFLTFFAGLNLLVGIIAALATFIIIFENSKRSSFQGSSYSWIISLAIALEGFLAFGLLSAIRDIAENMIDVGSYVRELRSRQNPSKNDK